MKSLSNYYRLVNQVESSLRMQLGLIGLSELQVQQVIDIIIAPVEITQDQIRADFEKMLHRIKEHSVRLPY